MAGVATLSLLGLAFGLRSRCSSAGCCAGAESPGASVLDEGFQPRQGVVQCAENASEIGAKLVESAPAGTRSGSRGPTRTLADDAGAFEHAQMPW